MNDSELQKFSTENKERIVGSFCFLYSLISHKSKLALKFNLDLNIFSWVFVKFFITGITYHDVPYGEGRSYSSS
jgi:hypothetical protein